MNSSSDTTPRAMTLLRIIYEPVPGVGGSIRHTIDLYKHIDPYVMNQCLINPTLEMVGDDHGVDGINISRPYKKSTLLTHILLDFVDVWFFVEKSVDYVKQSQHRLDQPVVIHAHGLLLGLYAIHLKKLKRLNVPIIIMVHGGYTKKDHNIGFSYMLGRLLMLISSPDAYVLLDDGSDIDSMIKDIKRNIPYTIVHHAIDTNEFHNLGDGKDTFFRILFPHRLVAVKSPEIALEVIKMLIYRIRQKDQIENPNLKLVFLTPLEDGQGIVKKYQLEDYVIYAGFQTSDGMVYEYNRADIVIGTSLSSNMGRATQEAMACETSVVVFQSGHMETLIEDKVDGFLVQSGDLNEMADLLYWAYHNRETLKIVGKNARDKIIKERSWGKRVEIELGVYERIMSEKSGGNQS